MTRLTPEELAVEAGKIGWFHTIPLGNGLSTPGHKMRQQIVAADAIFQELDRREQAR